jgi:hypothetical protein
MDKTFKKRQIIFLVQIFILSVILYGIHGYLLFYFGQDINLFFPLWQVYTFHFIVTALLFSIINYRYSSGKTEVFNLFMIMTFLKMTFAILFLLPLLLSDFENKQPDVFNFFIPYFIYLLFEVYSLTKFLQNRD